MFRETHFRLQKSTNQQNKHFNIHENSTELSRTVEVRISELPTILLIDVKGEYFAKGTEKCNVPSVLMKIVRL